jgi:hypothetical protein
VLLYLSEKEISMSNIHHNFITYDTTPSGSLRIAITWHCRTLVLYPAETVEEIGDVLAYIPTITYLH